MEKACTHRGACDLVFLVSVNCRQLNRQCFEKTFYRKQTSLLHYFIFFVNGAQSVQKLSLCVTNL